MNKVLITGLGMITPLGNDRDTSFAGALAARSAIRPAPEAICAGLPNLLAAGIATDPATLLDRQFAGLDRAAQLALVAAHEAMQQAALADSPVPDALRFGTYVGVGFAGAHTLDAMYARYFTALHGANARQATVMHPLSVPRMMANAPAAAVSMRYGLRGASQTFAVACASSAVALGEAARAIAHGYLDAVLVVGTESMLTAGCMVAWNALRVMAKPDAQDPSASCRPFALNRNGFVLGEGAAALVLESEAHARRRAAPPALAELAGYGSSSDAHHLTAPSVDGQVAAMRQALDTAGLRPDEVHYINAHGTATEAGDVIETQSIQAVFGETTPVPVSSTKAVHGHLIGAGGAVEFGLSVMALSQGAIPPTAHLTQPDPRCPLDHVPLTARRGLTLHAVMSNSFAFGGSNASLIAKRVPS